MRKALYALTIAGLVSIGLLAQQSGGAFIPSYAYDISGLWNFSTTPTLTAGGSVVGTSATQTLTNKTLTAPTVSAAALSSPLITEASEVVTATNVITAAESGTTFYVSAVAGFLSTLPAPAAGLNYRFVVKTAPTSNGYTIATTTSANIIYGMVEERAGTAGVACATEDLLTLVANQSIIGDWLQFRSDGTNWYVHGMTDVAAGFTCALT